MDDPVDLNARLDELFATEPAAFSATRDALARDLRTAGRDDEAATVKALRRPTLAVTAVNHAARTHPREVEALVDIGDQLADLQRSASPDRDELQDLTRERRALLHQLTELAAETTTRPDTARASIAATLDAASLDEHLRRDLLRGRLTHELSSAARFVTDDDTPAPPRRAPERARRATAPPRDELAARRARAELAAARDRAESAADAAQVQTEAASDAAARLDRAQRAVSDLEAALADARAELANVKREERDAQRAQRRALSELERVTAALHAAERAVNEDSSSTQP
jgi:hypothetical protein